MNEINRYNVREVKMIDTPTEYIILDGDSALRKKKNLYTNTIVTEQPAMSTIRQPVDIRSRIPNGIPYTSPINTQVVPNLHLDKATLSRAELAEVLMWALSIVQNGNAAEQIRLAQDSIVGTPNVFLRGLIDILATPLYGENNYIGPFKTGYPSEGSTLAEVVATVPALTTNDAIARAHDIALTVTDDPKVDAILPPLMQAAQVIRPLLLGRAGGMGNRELLKLAGDVEENPGPKEWELTNAIVIQLLKDLASNPGSALSYLSRIGTDNMVDYQNYYLRWGTVNLRSSADNLTDMASASDNWIQMSGVTMEDVVGAAHFHRHSTRTTRYDLFNRESVQLGRSNLYGAGLTGALLNFQDFLAQERTANNIVNGDNALAIWERMSSADYGMYIGMSKLLILNDYHLPRAGDHSSAWRIDAETRFVPAGGAALNASSVYPRSIHVAKATIAIDATWITQSQYVDYLKDRSGLGLFDPNNGTVASFVYKPGMSNVSKTLLCLTGLEHPFAWTYDYTTGVIVGFAVGNAIPNQTIVNQGAHIAVDTLIDYGKRTKVIFVKTNDSTDNIVLDGGAGLTTNVPQYPATADIEAVLVEYWENNFTSRNLPPLGFQEVFDYYSMCMSLDDWMYALCFAASVIFRKMPFHHYGLRGAGASIGPLWSNIAPPPAVDASVTLTAIQGAPGTDILGAIDNMASFNVFGVPDHFTDLAAAVGTPQRLAPIGMRYQNSTLITYFGVFTKMLEKNTIWGKSILEVPKVNPRVLRYTMWDMANILSQCTHHWFQDNGTTKKHILCPADMQLTLDLRLPFFNRLGYDWCLFIKKLGQICFLTHAAPAFATYKADNNFFNRDTYLDSPLILHADIIDMQNEKGYFGIATAPSWVISSIASDWAIGNIPTLNLGGVAMGGTNSVIVPHEGVNNGTLTAPYKLVYAISQCAHLINPAVVTRMQDVALVRDGPRTILALRPCMLFFKNFLKWTSGTTPSDAFRSGQRVGLGMFLPYYPPAEDVASGNSLLYELSSQGVATGIRGFISLAGQGSSNFQFAKSNQSGTAQRMSVPDAAFQLF